MHKLFYPPWYVNGECWSTQSMSIGIHGVYVDRHITCPAKHCMSISCCSQMIKGIGIVICCFPSWQFLWYIYTTSDMSHNLFTNGLHVNGTLWLNALTLLSEVKWATSWENLFMPYANNKGADQPAHPRSLISTFVNRYMDSIISLVSISKISSLKPLWPRRPVRVLPGCLVQTPKIFFHVTGLTWYRTRTMGREYQWLNCTDMHFNRCIYVPNFMQ